MKFTLNGINYDENKVYTYENSQPIFIELISLDDQNCFVNGIPGKQHFIQFRKNGKHKIFIIVGDEEKLIEVLIKKKINHRLSENNLRFNVDASSTEYPYIEFHHDIARPEIVSIKLVNVKLKKTQKVSWNIGDDQMLDNTEVEININNYLKSGEIHTALHVAAQIIEPRNINTRGAIGKSTLVLFNEYELNKKNGLIRPRIEYKELISQSIESRTKKIIYEGKIIIENKESNASIVIDKLVIEHLTMGHGARFLKSETVDIVLGPNEKKEAKFSIPVESISEQVFGFAIHLKGTCADRIVVIDAYFEILEKLVRIHSSDENPIVPNILASMISRNWKDERIASLSTNQLANKLLEDLHNNPRLMESREIIEALDFLNNPNNLVKKSANMASGSNDLMSCTESAEGLVDTIGLEEFVCQLVPDSYEMITVPARIVNAKKGDVIITPSGDSLVGKMMFSVFPPQYYSHCGIMTENYTEIRHSTASEDWYVDNLTQDDDGVDMNVDGIIEDAIRYGWPGTVTQTVSNTYYGEQMKGRQLRHQGVFDYFNDKEYEIKGFSQYTSKYNKEPKVIKPNPFDESKDYNADSKRNVRSVLNKVAEEAKKIDAHYRFYCYSNADIFFKPEFEMPDDIVSKFWLNQEGRNPKKPTVCSSMIWAAVKSVLDENIEIEGELELNESNANSSTFVELDSQTSDGLYLYSEAERLRAATNLYDQVWELAHEKGGDLGDFFENVSTELGNQFCNTFASDFSDSNSLESTAWMTPGKGRAVSPDDILNNWDGIRTNGVKYGLYGYNEKLLFRPERFMSVPKYRWVKIGEKGIIKGRAIDRNGNTFPNLQINYTNNLHVVTDSQGRFEIKHYPSFVILTAHVEVNGKTLSGETEVEIIGNQTIENIDFFLENPNVYRRLVSLDIIARIHDDELVGSHTGSHNASFPNIYLDLNSPTQQVVKRFVNLTEDTEVRAKYNITFTVLADSSVRVDFIIQLWEADGSTYDFKKETMDTFIVPKDTADFQFIAEKLSDDGDYVTTTFVMNNLEYEGA